MLLDQFLPRWDFSEHHQTLVRAPAVQVYRAARTMDLSHSLFTSLLMRLRELPWRLRGRSPRLPQKTFTLDKMLEAGFVLLGQAEPRELVLGLVGQPWRWSPELVRIRAEQFETFSRSGQVKVAMNMLIEPLAPGLCRLSSETRVQATSPSARRRFLPYWLLIRPFSGLIRREMLRAIVGQALRQKK